MQAHLNSNLSWKALAAAISIAVACAGIATAAAQANPPAASPSIPLTPYTAPDQSASAGVPAGWKVTSGSQTVIVMTGPQGETVALGNTVIAHNAPFQLGEKASGGVDLSMPYSAPLTQKLTMILQQGAAANGKPAPQVTFNSATPIQLPAALGQCGRFVASVTGAAGAMNIMGAFCSLPLDSAGDYKNISLMAQAPAATAAQSAPAAAAIFASYKIPPAMLQKKLAPFTAAPSSPAGNPAMTAAAINAETMQMQRATDTSATCFDLSVLRETPTRQLPRECGGTAPNP
jgi:hypothetical protein